MDNDARNAQCEAKSPYPPILRGTWLTLEPVSAYHYDEGMKGEQYLVVYHGLDGEQTRKTVSPEEALAIVKARMKQVADVVKRQRKMQKQGSIDYHASEVKRAEEHLHKAQNAHALAKDRLAKVKRG